MQEKKKYQIPWLSLEELSLLDVLDGSLPVSGDDFGTGETEWGEWN